MNIFKRLLFLSCLNLLCLCGFGQSDNPVKWTFSFKKIKGDSAVLLLQAKIESGWHLYSQKVQSGGPVKTSFEFEDGTGYEVVGATAEPVSIEKFEPVFTIRVNYFENSVVFKQKIYLKTAHPIIKGNVEYMVCNDKQCMPPKITDFKIVL